MTKTYSRREILAMAAGGSIFSCKNGITEAPAAVELSATEAVAVMKAGDIKAEDYSRALLDRADSLQSLNAFRSLSREAVLEAARAADKVRTSGRRLGALHGLPIPVALASQVWSFLQA